MKLNEFFREGDMRFPDLTYDKYGMYDYSAYTDVISKLVQRGMGKIQIQRELEARFHVMARDARSLIQRWEQENKQQVRSQSRIDAEAGGGGGGGAAGGTGGGTGGDGGSTGSSGDSGSADSGGAGDSDSNSSDSTPTAEPRGVGLYFAYGLRPSKNSKKKKKKKKKSSSGFDFGKGVYERKDMPQIKESDLEENSISYKKGIIKTENIIPMQKDRSKKMHKKAYEKFNGNNYDHLIVDKNNKLINGHHRLDVALQLEKKYVKAIKVNATLESLMKTFAHTTEDIKTRTPGAPRGRSKSLDRKLDVFKNPDRRQDTGMLDVMVPDRLNLEPEWNYNKLKSPIENFTDWFREKRKDPNWKYSEQESWSIFKDKYKDMMQ